MSGGWIARIEPMQPAVGDGARVRFTTQRPPWPGTLRVFVNGVSYGPDDPVFGWTVLDPSAIELRTAPMAGDPVECFYDEPAPGCGAAVTPPVFPAERWHGSAARPIRRSARCATLIDDLIDVVDGAREMLADTGLRQTTVRLVWVGWAKEPRPGSTMRRKRIDLGAPPERPPMIVRIEDLEPSTVGVGSARILREIELTPRPAISGSLTEDQDAFGDTERGSATVSQVSLRYPADLLVGLYGPFRDPEDPAQLREGIEFFWELEDVSATQGRLREPWTRQELPQPRRRYHVVGVPQRQPESVGWTVPLARADGDRDVNGSPVGAPDR